MTSGTVKDVSRRMMRRYDKWNGEGCKWKDKLRYHKEKGVSRRMTRARVKGASRRMTSEG